MADKNYKDWIALGDEWIISYLKVNFERPWGRAISLNTPSVMRFSIAHALEQYFKACIVKKYNSEEAKRSGHKIFNMYKDLKSDRRFLPEIDISQSMFDNYSIEGKGYDKLDPSLAIQIIDHQYILILFKYTADLKYRRLNKAKGTVVYVDSTGPELRYAKIIFEIRKYLLHTPDIDDLLVDALAHKVFKHEKSKEDFLRICTYGDT